MLADRNSYNNEQFGLDPGSPTNYQVVERAIAVPGKLIKHTYLSESKRQAKVDRADLSADYTALLV